MLKLFLLLSLLVSTCVACFDYNEKTLVKWSGDYRYGIARYTDSYIVGLQYQIRGVGNTSFVFYDFNTVDGEKYAIPSTVLNCVDTGMRRVYDDKKDTILVVRCMTLECTAYINVNIDRKLYPTAESKLYDFLGWSMKLLIVFSLITIAIICVRKVVSGWKNDCVKQTEYTSVKELE